MVCQRHRPSRSSPSHASPTPHNAQGTQSTSQASPNNIGPRRTAQLHSFGTIYNWIVGSESAKHSCFLATLASPCTEQQPFPVWLIWRLDGESQAAVIAR